MNYKRIYGKLIFTDHAIKKMIERGMPQEMAWTAFSDPDKEIPGKTPGSKEFVKKIDNKTATVIAKKNEKGEWVVVSAWMDPPLPGTKDAKEKERFRKFQKATFWQKILLTLRSQVGL